MFAVRLLLKRNHTANIIKKNQFFMVQKNYPTFKLQKLPLRFAMQNLIPIEPRQTVLFQSPH